MELQFHPEFCTGIKLETSASVGFTEELRFMAVTTQKVSVNLMAHRLL